MTKFLIPVVVLATFSASEARDLFEVEPNDTAFTAYDPGFLQHGDRLRGNLGGDPNGGWDADFWWLRTPAQEPGIYENRFRMGSSPRSFYGRLIGQSYDGVITPVQYTEDNFDADVYTRWYSFGRESRVNYAMVSPAIVPVGYAAPYEQVRITPTDLGQFAPGMFRIQELSTNSNVTVIGLDRDFNVVPQLTRAGSSAVVNIASDLAPGQYTIGVGFGPTSANMVDPTDTHFSARSILGENAIVNDGFINFDDGQAPLVSFSSGSFMQTLDWRSEVRSRGTHSLAYYQFEVVPEGDAGIALAVGIGALAMTRRRSS